MTEKKHIAVVFNPVKMPRERLEAVFAPLNEAHNYAEIQWFETSATDHGTQAAKDAIASGAASIVASGGDGTVRVVAEQLGGTDIPLTIIPQGTGNLLARNLGMPLDNLYAQASAAYAGDDFRMDLGVAQVWRADDTVEKKSFLVLAGVGFDARVMNNTNPRLKEAFEWLAYVDAGLRQMAEDQSFRFAYAIDKKRVQRADAYTVMVGNCGLMPGGMRLIPHAKMNDGKLDVVALKPLSRFRWLSWVRIFAILSARRRTQEHGESVSSFVNDSRNVRYRVAKTLKIRLDEAQPVQLDGDGWGDAIAMSADVREGALVVRVLPEWRI